MKSSLKVAVLAGRSDSPAALAGDLHRLAGGAAGESARPIEGYLVCASVEKQTNFRNDSFEVLYLEVKAAGRLAALAQSAAGKAGPIGILGRLLRENLDSRRLQKAFRRRPDLAELFLDAAVVVAVDVVANRTVWSLRRASTADLMSGPGAMVHAIRRQNNPR